jgi:hypothetical protein
MSVTTNTTSSRRNSFSRWPVCVRLCGILPVLLAAALASGASAAAQDGPPAVDPSQRDLLSFSWDLQVTGLSCSFDTLVPGQSGVPVTVSVRNGAEAGVDVFMVRLIFSDLVTGDRDGDYIVTGDVSPNLVIPAGGTADFDLFVYVDPGALIDREIRVDAYVFGQRLDTFETLSDTTSTEVVADAFGSISWSGSDGSLPWSGDWVEEGDDGDPYSGYVGVVPVSAAPPDYAMRIGGTNFKPAVGATRLVDLSDAAEARLVFTWRRELTVGALNIQVSADGTDWSDLQLITAGTDPVPLVSSFDITPWAGPGTMIRFRTRNAGNGSCWFDNVAVHYRSDSGAHRWTIVQSGITTVVALFDTRGTADRSDDILVAERSGENIQINTEHHIAGGAPIAEIPFESPRWYRLVLQLHAATDWDWKPKETGDGWLALADTSQGFGRLGAPQTGRKELLLTEAMLADEENDAIDYLVGCTDKADPPSPWSMTSDPLTDPSIDTGKVRETGALILSGAPSRMLVDCRDGGDSWEITGQCETGRWYFHEVWFSPDVEWRHGDDAGIVLHLDGEHDDENLEALYVHLRMVDDDTTGPVLSGFEPEIVREGEVWSIRCLISDPSGVYDDGTGAGGQGVWVAWDTDGSLADGYNETLMSRSAGDTFVTDDPMPVLVEGDEVVYRIYAFDDDADTGPADRSQTVSPLHKIQVTGTIAIGDDPGSIDPVSVYPDQPQVRFRLSFSNPNPEGLTLSRSSMLFLTDGVDTVKAHLGNMTFLPSGASGFPVVFDPVDIPHGLDSPDTADVHLLLEGVYGAGAIPFSQLYTASATNRVSLLEPRLGFTAHTAAAAAVHPGRRLVELLRVEVASEGFTDCSIDSIVVHQPEGWSARQMDAGDGSGAIERIYLYRQAEDPAVAGTSEESAEEELPRGDGERPVETGRPFDPTDLLVADGPMESGRATLRLYGGRLMPAGASAFYYVVADIDSFAASDGESVNMTIPSPDSVFIDSDISVVFSGIPLDSEGDPSIDGFMSFQAHLKPLPQDTIYSGTSYCPVLAVDIPSNGDQPDVLTAVTVRNYGDAGAGDAIEAVRLWVDNGDGVFSSGSDIYLGRLYDTGDRYTITGLAVPVASSRRLFVTAEIGNGFTEPLRLRAGIPVGGLEYVSANDGPIDAAFVYSSAQMLVRREYVFVAASGAGALPAVLAPGDRDAGLLALRLTNSTLDEVTLDSLVVTASGDPFPCEPSKPLRLSLDTGDSVFDPVSDPAVSTCLFGAGEGAFAVAGVTIPADSSALLFVSADIDTHLTADGTTVVLRVADAGAVRLSAATDNDWEVDGLFPAEPLQPPVTDGMFSYQMTVYAGADSTLSGSMVDVLVLDLGIPGNACLGDTLTRLTVVNAGTAGDRHIARMKLWADDGDGAFDPLDDMPLAELPRAGDRVWVSPILSVPLAASGLTRLFATVDLLDGFQVGATIKAGVPRMGIETASGNDGPRDIDLYSDNTLVIPIPDRITLFTSILGNKRVNPGDEDRLNMVLGAYNSYDEPRTISSLTLLESGTAVTGEIAIVRLWSDADDDGMFDPAADSIIAEQVPGGVLVTFKDLSFDLHPYESNLLFVSYSLPLHGVRDSVSVDFGISDQSLITFEGGDMKIEGEFPLNSAGVDFTDGMTAGQVSVLHVDDRRVSPGDTDVPCLSLRIPCNGYEEDVLSGIDLENSGSCLPGIDIEYLRLWREAGGDPQRFDEGQEDQIGLLAWNGSRWTCVSQLSEPIDCQGLVIHVTADFSATARDGTGLAASIPVGGIEVVSGDDGPLDASIQSTATLLVTTEPLLVSFDIPARVTSGQQFEVVLNAVNAADTILTQVRPDSFSWSGGATLSLDSGPVPDHADIPGQGYEPFTYTLTAGDPGAAVFRARAVETGGDAVSWFELSDTLLVEDLPAGMAVALDDISPISLNRGYRDASLVEIALVYPSGCSQCASVRLARLRVSFADGSGDPVAVGAVASKIVLEDEERVLYSAITLDSTSSVATLTPAIPVLLAPGDARLLKFSIDVSDTASAEDFRIGIASTADIDLRDENSQSPVAYEGATPPWTTSTVTVKDPVLQIAASMEASLPAMINRGQSGIEAFALTLSGSGGPSTADVHVSSVVLTVLDSGGVPIDPSSVLRRLRIEDESGFAYFSTETFPAGGEITCALQPELTVSPGVPAILRARVDCPEEPDDDGFALSIARAEDLTCRDANSGNTVEVVPAGDPFPMTTGTALFVDPVTGVSVFGSGLLPGDLSAGMDGVDAILVTVTHDGAAGESDALVTGLSMRLIDNVGTGLAPVDLFDKIGIYCSDELCGALYPTARDTVPSFTIPLDTAVVIGPTESMMIHVKCDIAATAPAGMLQLQIDGSGIDVRDATDGGKISPVAGTFPISSGIAAIRVPADEILFAAAPVLPANVTGGEEVPVFDLSFDRGDPSGGADVLVDGLGFEVDGRAGECLDPSLVISSARFESGAGQVPCAITFDTDHALVAFDVPPAVGDGGRLDLRMYLTLRRDASCPAFSVSIVQTGDVHCTDALTGGAVPAVSPAGTTFPFATGMAAYLGSTIAGSFSNYPNPFVPARGPTRITFNLSEPSFVTLEVYTVLGDLVERILDGERLSAGLHQDATWDGRNGRDEPVLNGVYYLVLRVNGTGGEQTFRRKIALVH